MHRETHMRSVVKAVSWRVLATMTTTGLVFLVTRELTVAVAIGGLEFISKLGLYWMHERLWNRLRFGKTEIQPVVLWFTGLSGSGKSTVSSWVANELRARGLRVEQLDGDTIRNIFPKTGFSKAERDAHITRVGYLASKLEQNGVFVVASFVSPYRESRDFVRGLCRNFVEIHMSTPLAECERRDVKGLYARARRGEITNFTGIDDPYETPRRADLVLDTTELDIQKAGERVLDVLRRRFGRVGS